MACKTIEQAIKELYYAIRDPDATNFSAMLYRLIGKSDMENRHRLADAFPLEYAAYAAWKASPNEAEFWKANGLDKKR